MNVIEYFLLLLNNHIVGILILFYYQSGNLIRARIYLGLCELPKKHGHCGAAISRVNFDPSSGMCRDFLYGGCQGNGNNFNTKKECGQICGGNPQYEIMYE